MATEPEPTYLGQLCIRELPIGESTADVFKRMLDDAMFKAMVKAGLQKVETATKPSRVVVGIASTPRNDEAYCGGKMAECWKQIAAMAARKDIDDLTGREQFCIAFAAGVDIEPFTLPNTIGGIGQIPTVNFRTKKPIAMAKVEGGFRVFTCRSPAGPADPDLAG